MTTETATERGGEWRSSACILCECNCGILVKLGGEDGRCACGSTGGGVWGWGRDVLGTGARGRGARALRALISTTRLRAARRRRLQRLQRVPRVR
jgi:hypothetical protein